MTPERYAKLQDGPEPQTLMPEELKQGWHWCVEMDGLLCLVGDSDCFCVEDKQRFALVPVVFDKTTMNTNQLGAIGMAQAILEYQKRGYCVSIPLIDAQEYDLVIEKDEVFQSVQCKYTSRKSSSNPVSYEIGLRTSSLNRSIKNKGTFDLLFILCSDGTCYSIPTVNCHKLPQVLDLNIKNFNCVISVLVARVLAKHLGRVRVSYLALAVGRKSALVGEYQIISDAGTNRKVPWNH